MNVPKKFEARVYKSQYLNTRVIDLILEVVEPNEIHFEPGQFINIQVSDTTFRSYSVYSSSTDTKHVGILASVAHEGVGAAFLKKLQQGDQVTFIGPSGKFTLPAQLANELVFIATGTGLAPILSMLTKLGEMECKNKIRLYFGVRNEEELFKVDELVQLTKSLENFEFYLCFSQELPGHMENKNNILGRVTSQIMSEDFTKAQFFLCGNPYMIHDALGLLKEKNTPDQNIFHEKFTVSLSADNPKSTKVF